MRVLLLILALILPEAARAFSIYEVAGIYTVETVTGNHYRMAIMPMDDRMGHTISFYQIKNNNFPLVEPYVFTDAKFNAAKRELYAKLTNDKYHMQILLSFDAKQDVHGTFRATGPWGDVGFRGKLIPVFRELLKEGRSASKQTSREYECDRFQGKFSGITYPRIGNEAYPELHMAEDVKKPAKLFVQGDLRKPYKLSATYVFRTEEPQHNIVFSHFHYDNETNLIYLSGRRQYEMDVAHLLIISPDWVDANKLRGVHVSALNASARELEVFRVPATPLSR